MLVVFLAAMLGPASVAWAVSIAVVVNGQPITTYDISQRVALMEISGQSGSTAAATEQLIDEAIQLEEATRRGIQVPQSQIEGAFASIAQQVSMSTSQFSSALRDSGVDPDSLRRRLRAQLAWSALLQQRVAASPVISQQDITAAMLAQGTTGTVREFRLQPIVFVIPANSSSAYVDQRRSEAESFRQRFTGCDNALAQAQTLRGVVVLDIVRRDSTQLTGDRGAEIMGTAIGRVTRPVRTAEGMEIIAVCAVSEVQNNEAVRGVVENQLMIEQGDQIGAEYLAELRESAIIQRF